MADADRSTTSDELSPPARQSRLAKVAWWTACAGVAAPFVAALSLVIGEPLAWLPLPEWVFLWPLVLPPVAFLLALAALAGLIVNRLRQRPALRGGSTAGAAALLSLLWVFPSLMMTGSVAHDFRGLRSGACLRHVKELDIAMGQYVADHGGVYPEPAKWCENLRPYLRDNGAFRCPNARRLRCAYAYNSALSGLRPDDLANPARVVVFFESDRGWDAAGGRELLAGASRHDNYHALGLADGHARVRHRFQSSADSQPQWQPTLKQPRPGRPTGARNPRLLPRGPYILPQPQLPTPSRPSD